MVDIVDDYSKKVAETTKGEAHRKGLLHSCVISEVIDPGGRWLLVKQSSKKQDAGRYVSPVGGHVRAGEPIGEALKREAFEELGMKGFKYRYVGKVIFNRHVIGRQENHYFFTFEIYSDQKPRLNHESESCRYFTESEISEHLSNSPQIFGDAFLYLVDTVYSGRFPVSGKMYHPTTSRPFRKV